MEDSPGNSTECLLPDETEKGRKTVEKEPMLEYYSKRSREYESIYQKPERQADLGQIKSHLSRKLADKQVLEIACGTGYWTEVIAPSAASIVGVDANEAVLAIARSKNYGGRNVRFQREDCYHLPGFDQSFDAGLGLFWWSHVPRERQVSFLEQFLEKLCPGAAVIFVDNRFVPGSSTPLARRDDRGNTYQARKLQDGSEFEVLKNFPTSAELERTFEPFGKSVEVRNLEYFWIVEFERA